MNFLRKIKKALLFFQQAFGGYKWQILTLTVVGFLSGILEGIGANALIPLFSFVTGESGVDDFISRTIEHVFAFVGIDFTLRYLLIFVGLMFVLKAVVLFIGSYIQLKIMLDYQKRTRLELFKKSLRSEWRHSLEQKIGHLEKVLSSEIAYVSNLFSTISSLILIFTSLCMFLLVAINISFSITAITVGVGVAVLILFQPLVHKIREVSKAAAVKAREIAHFINENVIGMKTVKAMSSAEAISALGDGLFEETRKLQMRRGVLGIIFGSFFQPFGIIFILFLFSFSYTTGSFNLPAFIALVYLIQRIFGQIYSLQTHMQTIFSSLPYLENVLAFQERAMRNKEEDTGGLPFTFEKSISFKNVSFGYRRGKEILSAVSFEVRKCAFVGLIGPSGAGKTTIVDLALRLFKPDSGNILLDGVSIGDINLADYRHNVGYVSQDIHLINDTVANNIRFFDETMTDEEIAYAAKQAHIYDVIEALPQKFSSVVGERGVRLSAGQRQRVVIARVLAPKPQFLILDEATSALDNESEKRVQEVIENLRSKITVLVIAHRLGTVLNCGSLLVLDKGRIIEAGPPQELLKDKDSYFFKMYNIRE